MSSQAGWGPSKDTNHRAQPMWFMIGVGAIFAVWLFVWPTFPGLLVIVIPAGAVLATVRDRSKRSGLARQELRGAAIARAPNPLAIIRTLAREQGGGVYLGAGNNGSRFARPEGAALILGPPRSGKTSSVIIPSLLAHAGPTVCTSTKPDLAAATGLVRRGDGRVWMFDPTGAGHHDGSGFGEMLRWSPISSAISWDGALLIARAMTSGIGAGTTDRSHWSNRAQALSAPLLHAAAVDHRDMETVVDWVMRHELDEAGNILELEAASRLAFNTLLGLDNTEDRERSSIFSATADALQAYTSEHALTTAKDPNFDAESFVRSGDTIYVHAPGEAQAAAAPIVCGLLAEIRRATYRAHATGELAAPVLFALDEVANIAPLEELPQIASEGGGQGLVLLAALQDLSQARARWGQQADGFLTLFGTKVILPGVADTRTLESISVMLGEYDRTTTSRTSAGWFSQVDPTKTVSTQRQRVLSPGEIANILAGHGLHLDGVNWELLTLTPAHTSEPWKTITAGTRR